MVTLNDYKASSIKVRNICGMKTKQKKNQDKTTKKKVLKDSPVLGHSYNTAWIQRLEEFGWD